MEKLSFLEGESPVEEVRAEEAVVPEVTEAVETPQQPEVTEEPRQEPVRDERGRFAPKSNEEAGPPPGYVPVGVVSAMRQEIQQLKASLQPPQPAPDIFEDQDGFIDQRVMQPVQNQITMLNLNWSRRFAEQTYGAETVNTAEQWVMQQVALDPAYGQKIIGTPDPYGAAVAEYKQHQVMSQLSDPSRIDAFLAWEAAQKAAQTNPTAAAPAAQPQQTPTRSLATAPSSGGAAHVPQGPGQAFDNLFTR